MTGIKRLTSGGEGRFSLEEFGVMDGKMLLKKDAERVFGCVKQARVGDVDKETGLRIGVTMVRRGSVLRPVGVRVAKDDENGVCSGVFTDKSGGWESGFWAVGPGWKPPERFWDSLCGRLENKFGNGGLSEEDKGVVRVLNRVVDRAKNEPVVILAEGADMEMVAGMKRSTVLRAGARMMTEIEKIRDRLKEREMLDGSGRREVR
ncbi:hypothetical protein KKC08_03725 [Patescibacteria group bacterium]|nr:hypothetical protein [Patescibacteria group bacterium]MCG2702029.1 hypothetical protein [Candidatus Parcubacteria bacterium]MBU4265549.1 hypothetical protein [Patescibacteria group bacterium]MBU4389878.1 hypothetical protein [Patescibacteria group bacterium]MBU4397249.1 hypothetical protein [Patescibacteria group bacterium]